MAELKNLYDDVIMDHIRNARNYHKLDGANREAEGSNPLCGDVITVYLKLSGEVIEDIGFQCTCCGVSMASASIMTESVKGKNKSEVNPSFSNSPDCLRKPSLTALPPLTIFLLWLQCANFRRASTAQRWHGKHWSKRWTRITLQVNLEQKPG